MLHRKIGICAAALLLVSHGGFAAEDLLRVYREAVDGDPTLRRAAATREAIQEQLPQARALMRPRIDGVASKTYIHTIDGEERIDGTSNSQTIGIAVVQPLFNRPNQLRGDRAEVTATQAEVDYNLVEQRLIVRVVDAYFDVLEARDELEFVLADKQATSRQLEQAQQRFEVGLITITDVEEAQAALDRAIADEVVARNGVQNQLEALREITGENYDALYILSNRLPLEAPQPSNPDDWVRVALENNPEVKSSLLGTNVARADVDIRRAERLPTLDLEGAVNHNRNNSRNPKAINDARIGVQLNVPIFEGGAKSSRIREAAFQFEASKEELEGDQRAVVRNIRDSYRGVIAAIRLIEARDQARNSAQSSLEATEAGYDVGTRTIVDVLEAQRELFRAERDYAIARYAYIRNQIGLKQAAGTIAAEDIVELNGWLEQPGS